MDPYIRSLFIKIAVAILIMSAVVAGLVVAFDDGNVLPAANTSLSTETTTAEETATVATTSVAATTETVATATIEMPKETSAETSAGTLPSETTAETTAATTTTTSMTTPTAATTTTPETTAATTTTEAEPEGLRTVHPELEGSRQIVLCYVSNSTTSYCTVVVYEKDASGVLSEVMRVDGRVGSTGIEPEETRLQDTGKTPAGVHRLITAFGINDDPGAKFDYIKVTSEMYWDLNSGSTTYNRLVYSYPGGDCERLASYTRTYKYAFVTDYNYAQTAGKGGAIFLHCNGAGATAGCVSLPEENMVALMKLLNPAKNPVLVVALESEIGSYIR